MKRVLLVLLIAIIAIPTFQSCKKGENDPAISLRSRKARLVGEWKLSQGTVEKKIGSNVLNYAFDGAKCVTTGDVNTTTNYTEDLSIMKDGTFTFSIFDDGKKIIYLGNWYFLGANKDSDIKNKECVNFVITKCTYTPPSGTTVEMDYTGFYYDLRIINLPFSEGNGFTWQLDELKNKEIIVKFSFSIKTPTDTNSYTGTLTYVQ
jgi:hypothetical protein